jgi:hypothetical protein
MAAERKFNQMLLDQLKERRANDWFSKGIFFSKKHPKTGCFLFLCTKTYCIDSDSATFYLIC